MRTFVETVALFFTVGIDFIRSIFLKNILLGQGKMWFLNGVKHALVSQFAKNHQLSFLNPFCTPLRAFMAILYLGGGICDLAAYVPVRLSGKYQFGSIDTSFYYGYWMQTFMKKIYCTDASYKNPEQAVKDSFCPSAMVDNSGTLYAITVYGFSSSKGPNFLVKKCVPSGNSISVSSYSSHYFWDTVCRQYGTSANAVPSCDSWPCTSNHPEDPGWCANGIHNLFSPTIAQEIPEGSTDYIYICYLSPPLRWMNPSVGLDNHDTEGLVVLKISKSNISQIDAIKCVATDQQHDRAAGCGYFPFRTRSWAHKLQPEWGPCKAFFDGTYIHYFQMANESLNTGSLDSGLGVNLRYKKINASTFAVVSYSTVDGMFNRSI